MTTTTAVRLAFGETGLKVELPADRTTVVEPIFQPGAPEPPAMLREALRRPVSGPRLREMVRPGQSIAIAVCDGTRPQPRALMIPAVLDELDGVVRFVEPHFFAGFSGGPKLVAPGLAGLKTVLTLHDAASATRWPPGG